MARVLWQPVGHPDKLLPLRCAKSGREEFNDYEAAWRARKACRDGTAALAMVVDGGTLLRQFERLANGGVVQTAGEEFA